METPWPPFTLPTSQVHTHPRVSQNPRSLRVLYKVGTLVPIWIDSMFVQSLVVISLPSNLDGPKRAKRRGPRREGHGIPPKCQQFGIDFKQRNAAPDSLMIPEPQSQVYGGCVCVYIYLYVCMGDLCGSWERHLCWSSVCQTLVVVDTQ